MAGPYYLSSVNGNDGNNGLSKAQAKATFASVLAAMSAGETLRVDEAHSQTFSVSQTLTWPGIDTNPNIVISIDWASDTYSRATTRQLRTSNSGNDISMNGSCIHYGMFYEAMDDFKILQSIQLQRFEDCTLDLKSSGSSITLGNTGGGNKVVLVDTEYKNVSGGDGLQMLSNTNFEWRNGPNNRSKYTNPGTSPTQLIAFAARDSTFNLVGVDLSDLTTKIFSASSTGTNKGTVINCLLNSGVSLVGAVGRPGSMYIMIGCDDTTGNDLYRTEIADFYGTTVTDDANYNDSGASDKTNNISWKMVSNANATEFHESTKSHWIGGRWIDSTGSKTFLIETNSENVTFQDDELWLELEFLDAAANTQTSGANDRMLGAGSAPANQADSAADPTWTTPGITTEKKQQLSITVTVNRVGPFRVRVCLAKPSATVWIDPKVTVS